MTVADIRTVEELDGAEARLVLLDLPPMDVDRVRPSFPIRALRASSLAR